MNKIRVNLNATVNSKAIRKETHNGKDHYVVPSYTLPSDVVMNGIMYPAKEIDANFHKLEGTLAPLGHPMVNGDFVSAFSAEGINVGHIGAWNRNVKKVGHRVYSEKWIDIEYASRSTDGQRLLDRIDGLTKGEGEPIHTSVAVYLEEIPALNEDAGYRSIAKIHEFDHDAILLDQPGAATPEQGVGLMVNVNVDQACMAPTVNRGVLADSYGERRLLLQQAAQAKFVTSKDQYVYLEDFNDQQMIIYIDGNVTKLYDYQLNGEKVTISDVGQEVQRQESWVKRLPFVNHIIELSKYLPIFSNSQARPDDSTGGDMPITQEETAAIAETVATKLADMVKVQVNEAVSGLTQQVTTLAADHKALADGLTANTRAQESEKRAEVAKVYGEVIANALQGEALEDAFKRLGSGTAPALNPNHSATGSGDITLKAID